ncbi:MAG: oligosaccharide flippase family protein [Candidatus Eremiobacteraeota bacterium]|nr:oligosaccharide flippase family protein [Candidatus Eremiobacteraeota bacterium]
MQTEKNEKKANFHPQRGVKSYIFVFTVIIVGFLFTYILNSLIARNLSQAEYGDFKFAISIAQILATLALLGGGDAIPRFVPNYVKESKWNFFKGYIQHYLIILLLTSIIIICLSGLITYNTLTFLGKELSVIKNYHPVSYMIFLVPFLALSFLLLRIIECIGKQNISRIPDAVISPIILFAFVLFVVRANIDLENHLIFIGLFCAMMVVVIIDVYIIFHYVPDTVLREKPLFDIKDWGAVAIPLMLSSFVTFTLTNVEIITLEIMPGNENNVGIFAAMSVIYSGVFLIIQAVKAVVNPFVAPLVKERNYIRLQKIYNKSFAFIALVNLIVCIVVILWGKKLLGHFGPEYVPYYYLLIIMIVFGSIMSPLQMVIPFLSYSGNEKTMLKINVAGLLISIVLAVALIYLFGLKGAVFVNIFGTLVVLVINAHLLKKTLKIKPYIIF